MPNIINNAIVAVSAGIGALSNNDFEEIGSRLTEHVPDDMVVSEFEVFRALCGLNKNKASLCDSISNKLLRGLAIELAAPICALMNNTLRTGQTPTQWRMSRIVPLPKVNPPRVVETDFRPIAITCPISKVAELFISDLFNMHFDRFIDDNQFGCVSGRSTTLALVKLTHLLFF